MSPHSIGRSGESLGRIHLSFGEDLRILTLSPPTITLLLALRECWCCPKGCRPHEPSRWGVIISYLLALQWIFKKSVKLELPVNSGFDAKSDNWEAAHFTLQDSPWWQIWTPHGGKVAMAYPIPSISQISPQKADKKHLLLWQCPMVDDLGATWWQGAVTYPDHTPKYQQKWSTNSWAIDWSRWQTCMQARKHVLL